MWAQARVKLKQKWSHSEIGLNVLRLQAWMLFSEDVPCFFLGLSVLDAQSGASRNFLEM